MEEEIDLKEIIKLLWRKKIFIIVTTLLFALVAFIKFGIIDSPKTSNSDNEKFYYAQTTFIVGTSQTSSTSYDESYTGSIPVKVTGTARIALTDVLVATYNEIIKSETNLKNVINKLDLSITTNDLSKLISVSRASTSDLLCLVVANQNEEQAVQIANELINEFINSMSKSYYVDNVSIIDSAYSISESQISSDVLACINTPSSIGIDSNKKTIKYVSISTIIGFILSAGIVLVINMFNETVTDISKLNIKQLLNVEKGNENDSFQILKIKLEENKTFLITSAENNNCKSYVSQNLATTFAKSNKKVLLLDLSTNSSELLEKYSGKGLFDYIECKNKTLNKYINKSNIDNLDILLKGSINNLYINEIKLQEIINDLVEKYDYIIIDSNNILECANTLEVAKTIKNTILVAVENKTNLDNFNNALEVIQEVNGNIIGGILIKNNK